jgi:hypothetical protein
MKVLLFLFTFSCCFSQQLKFQIKDVGTHQPIEFVSIDLLNGHGFYTNQNGEVSIDTLGVEKIVLSHLSFESKTFKIKDLVDVVYLKPKTIQLEEVKIAQNNKKVFITRKNEKQEESVHCDFGMYGYELAIPIKGPTEDKTCYLDEISIPIRIDEMWHYTRVEKVPLSLIKINFAKNINDIESDSLLSEPEYYFIDKKSLRRKKIEHKLKKKVLMPKEGLFCVITFLGKADENGNLIPEMPTYTSRILGKDRILVKYQPIQVPIHAMEAYAMAYCRGSFAMNSKFGKAFPRTSSPSDLTIAETKAYMRDKVSKMPNYGVKIDYKYYYYE